MQNAILLSIHPKYVDKIISGEKKFEFRKVVTRKYQPKKIFIYSTVPISKIIAEAEIEEILIDTPENIWKKTKMYSGIEIDFFLDYYNNKTTAIAYKLKNIKKFDQPLELSALGINAAPQSFIYIKDNRII